MKRLILTMLLLTATHFDAFLDAAHGDPGRRLYGFTAEQGGSVLPDLMGRDSEGKANTFDYLGVVPVLVRAVQELKAEVNALKAGTYPLVRGL